MLTQMPQCRFRPLGRLNLHSHLDGPVIEKSDWASSYYYYYEGHGRASPFKARGETGWLQVRRRRPSGRMSRRPRRVSDDDGARSSTVPLGRLTRTTRSDRHRPRSRETEGTLN
jgi:hypothetical protein